METPKSLKILLIAPACESVRVTPERPNPPKREMLRFSVLPLTAVAAVTPRKHEVRIVDENVEPLALNTDCDVVGITFMTALAPRAYEIAREFRSRGKTVIGGGYHATLCPEEATGHFDAIIAGDAEGAWEQALEDVAAGRLRKIYRAPACGELRVPVPRRELLRRTARRYITINAVQTGRGCSHGCRYCSVTAFHDRRYRCRPLGDVMAELRGIPRDFIFVDDNIAACRERTLDLLRAMQPLRKRWVAQCSIEAADDPELLDALQAAGCCGLFIGIETLSPQNLAQMDKGFNDPRRYGERLRRIRQRGIGVVAGIMVGLDQDDPGVFERSLQFLRRTHIDALQLNILTPLPGTPLFEDMQRSDRITDADWSHYDYRHVIFQPARMTAEQLQAGADWLYLEFYRLDRILWRFARTVFNCGWLPAWLGLRLSLTYRYDNRRDRLKASNPADERDRISNLHTLVCGD